MDHASVKIHPECGFFMSNRNIAFRDSPFELFSRKGFEKLFLTRGYTLVKISGTQHYLISRLVTAWPSKGQSTHDINAVLFLLWFLITAMLWVFYCKSHLFAANTVRCIWCRFPVTDWWLLMHGNSGKFKSTVILQ